MNVSGRPGPAPVESRTGPGPDRAWLALAFAAVVLGYAPVVFFEYGFSEDYRLLADFGRGAGLRPLMLAEGRPVFAVWAKLVFGGLHGIGSLAGVRLLNLGGLGLVAVLLALAFRRAGLASWESTMAAVAILSLPPFQLFAATAAMGAVAVGAMAGVAAGFAVHASCGESRSARRWWLRAAAVGLLLAGLATYQPTGLLFWVVAAIFLILANPPSPAFRRLAVAFAGVGALALFAELGIYELGRSAFPAELVSAPRAELAFDPLGKALWFLLFPLPHALNLWKLVPNLLLAMAMLIVLAAGLVLHVRGTGDRLARLFVALSLLPLCYVPNLLVVENRASFRSQPALVAIVLVYYLVVVRGQFGRTRRRLYRGILAAAALAGLASAARNVTVFFARPQAAELAIVRRTVAALPAGFRTIAVVPSDFRDTLSPTVLYDEFGYPSTALPWSAWELTWLALRERHPAEDTAAIRVFDPGAVADTAIRVLDGTAISADTVIDWGAVLRARPGRRPRG